MNFLLKIVEGPNKGAEIALVEGVAVTLGKGDDCDIVLADPTMPAEPMSVEVSESGVTIGGEAVEPFHVRTAGATSFAIGPADAPWGELVWKEAESQKPKAESPQGEPPRATADERPGGKTDQPADGPTDGRADENAAAGTRRHRGCMGCLVALVLLLLVLAGLAWFFRDRLKEIDWSKWLGRSGSHALPTLAGISSDFTLSAIAEKYGLVFADTKDGYSLSGNLKTRRDRLAATAEAYEAQPGVELDLSDDESFRTAAEDALFTLTEGELRVSVATNRFLGIMGTAASPKDLQKTLESLASDLPKLRDVDVSAVTLAAPDQAAPTPQRPNGKAAKRPSGPTLPVCGILTTPYPCLVMRDGKRVFEGGAIGDSVILKIEADSVTVTNSAGRFEWKP